MEAINPKISIIVPVYNVERYLPRTLDTILAQDFTDFELILINDGSSDLSGTICDNYATLDSRIRLFHRENNGVSSARNLGVDNARGEWIAFWDSDDWVDTKYLSTFINDLRKGGHQLYCYSWTSHYQTNNRTVENNILANLHKESISLSMLDCYTQLHAVNSYGFLWMKFFRTSIIAQHTIRFDVNVDYQEDILFTNDYLQYVDIVLLSSNKFYNYRRERGDSLATNILAKYSYNELRTKATAILLSTARLFNRDSNGNNNNYPALQVCVDIYLADLNTAYIAFYGTHNLTDTLILRKAITKDIKLMKSTITYNELKSNLSISKHLMVKTPLIYGILLYLYLKFKKF